MDRQFCLSIIILCNNKISINLPCPCVPLEYDPAQLGWAEDICACFSLRHPQKTLSKPQSWRTVSTEGLSSCFPGRTLEEFVYLSRLAMSGELQTHLELDECVLRTTKLNLTVTIRQSLGESVSCWAWTPILKAQAQLHAQTICSREQPHAQSFGFVTYAKGLFIIS